MLFGFILIRIHPKIWKCIPFPSVTWDLVVAREWDGEGMGNGEHNEVSVRKKN